MRCVVARRVEVDVVRSGLSLVDVLFIIDFMMNRSVHSETTYIQREYIQNEWTSAIS